jgi:hypothetical protein
MDEEAARLLIAQWKRQARRKFIDAKGEPKDAVVSTKRSLEMAAMCEANCAFALERLLSPAATPTSG